MSPVQGIVQPDLVLKYIITNNLTLLYMISFTTESRTDSNGPKIFSVIIFESQTI